MTKFSETDDKLKSLIKSKGLSSSRIRAYDKTFKEIYNLPHYKYTPSELLKIAREEEKSFIDDNNQISTIEMDDRTVYKLQLDYYDFLLDEEEHNKPLKPKTIINKLATYRGFFSFFNVDLPDAIEVPVVKNRTRDKDIPTWQDVKRATELAKSPRDRAVILFCATTGFRISDVISRTISDLIEACDIYFEKDESKTLNVLLSKNPDNIVPCWELNPKKTKRYSTLTVTFNTPETTSLIFDYLNYRIELNKRNDKGDVIELDEPLFASQRGGFLDDYTLTKQCSVINKRMGDEKDKNGVYGKFRLQNLRKLFKTTCRRGLQQIKVNSDKTFDGDVISLFTGHITPNNPLADVYEAVEDDSHDSYIRKIYQGLIPYLSIYPTETKAFKEQEYLEMEEKIETLEEQSQLKDVEHQREMDEKDKKIAELEQMVVEAKEEATSTKEMVEQFTQKRNRSDIRRSVREHFDINYRDDVDKRGYENGDPNIIKKDTVICELATEFALEDEKFNGTEEELDSVIKKAIATCSFNPEIVQEKYKLIHEQNERKLEDATLISNIKWDIKIIISNHTEIWEMVKDDEENLDKAIINTLIESDYDLNNLTDDDLEKISEEIIMDYLS